MKFAKNLRFLAAGLAVALLAACGGSGSAGNTLKIYTHNDPDEMKELVEDAQDATGLNIEVQRLSANEGYSRVEQEAPNFGADMQWGQLESMALRGVDEDYFEPYDSPTWEDVPDEFKDPEGRWYGWSFWYNLVAFNEDALKKKGLDVPESWEDLADPQYEGEITLPNPASSGTGYLFASTILQVMGEDDGWDYLDKLDQNIGQYTKSGSQPAELVGQGEYAIAVTWDQAVFDHIDEGYPLKPVYPSEGLGYSLDVLWMFKDTDQRDEVEELIDYIGSDEGMESIGKVRMPTKPGFESEAQPDNPEENFMDYDAEWADKHEDEIQKKWRERYQ